MKKIIFITALAVATIIIVQVFWIYNMYQRYITEFCLKTSETFVSIVESEVTIRQNHFSDMQKPRYFIKGSESMKQSEYANYKGDTLDLRKLQKQGLAQNQTELISQFFQDAYLEKGILPKLKLMDSLYFLKAEFKDLPHYFILYDNNDEIIDHYGKLSTADKNNCFISDKKKLGTKGLISVQIVAKKPTIQILFELSYAIIIAMVLIIIVISCLIYQIAVIRRKDELLEKREASVNGVVHDLKSPLAGLITLISWLKDDEKDIQKQSLLQSANNQLAHLNNSIELMLRTACADRRRFILHKASINLSVLTKETANDVSLYFSQKQHNIEIEDHLDNPIVQIDGSYMRNALKNLIENALKYSDDNVKITIKLERIFDKVQISVIDNGWGISKKYQSKLFRQYYQVPRESKRMLKGYGIGLAYVWHIIRAHRGRINLISQENVGSSFQIIIPQL